MSDTVINVKNVSKLYKLYDRPADRLKESLGLTKKKLYKEHYALSNVSFRINRGETVGIIGTNGSGKSTMLKIITGVLNPTGGDVEIRGRISALLELGAGFNMEYTGIENVYLNGTMNGFTREEIDGRLNDILEFADIGDFVHQPVKTYSSGMFVRLAFAVAINIDPEILIVDEALSVGDVFFQAKCFKKFEDFKEQGKTILFVSHDTGSIQRYCDKVILLNQGQKVAEGDTKKVVDLYKKMLVHAGETSGETEDEGAGVQTENDQNTWKNHISLNPSFLEYGDKQAEIVDFAVKSDKGAYTNIVEDGTEFRVKMKVHFHMDVEEPIFAMTIKNVQGLEIAGTNTMYEHISMGLCRKGEERIVEFRQKAVLQAGEYLLSLGCTGYKDGEFMVYHRLYDITNLTVSSDKYMVGFFDLGSTVLVK